MAFSPVLCGGHRIHGHQLRARARPGVGEVHLAPPGTPEPADPTTALAAPWHGLGLSTPDGVTIARTVEKKGTEHWQQLTPTRYVYTAQSLTAASVFQETKAAVLSAYFGGLRFTETQPGSKKYRAEISAIPRGRRTRPVRRLDRPHSDTEIYHHRLYIPRAEVSETEESQWTRTQEARWGMTFSALAPVGRSTVLAVWPTDDPAVLAATPAPLSSNGKAT